MKACGTEKAPIQGAPCSLLIAFFRRLPPDLSSSRIFYFNYCRPHMTLNKANGGVRTTPAMASGKATHVDS